MVFELPFGRRREGLRSGVVLDILCDELPGISLRFNQPKNRDRKTSFPLGLTRYF